MDTDCIGSCKSNYHTITTTTAPNMSGSYDIAERKKITKPEHFILSLTELSTFVHLSCLYKVTSVMNITRFAFSLFLFSATELIWEITGQHMGNSSR
jgi:hypothetical protein